ncbi:MAG: DUF1294 domain-containing protein [Alloalcanivorax venustensis]|jgi:uncharacterized membrane protein YsdA (DUF1294 family)/cold shock CspA family protein|uniref:DUF1294 domain-containing protein n=1 Tax=Alloalcanivorax venustensis TaxID=172371 RepID=UPI003001CFE2
MKQKGILTKWNDERGFGFITPAGGEETVFVHISAFARGQDRPALNRSLTYRLARDDKQRPRAEDVRFAVSRRRASGQRRGVLPALLVIGLFSAGLAFVVPRPEAIRIGGVYALLSAISFLLYGLDKRAATRGGWRTSEARLHLFELLGGWPGALLAQRVFRHKTRKAEFQVVFYLAVAANLGVLGWLLYANAGAELRATLGISQLSYEWLLSWFDL